MIRRLVAGLAIAWATPERIETAASMKYPEERPIKRKPIPARVSVTAVEWRGASRSAKEPVIGETRAPVAVTTVTRIPICHRAAENSWRRGVANTEKMGRANVDDAMVAARTAPRPILRESMAGHGRQRRRCRPHRPHDAAGTQSRRIRRARRRPSRRVPAAWGG